MTNSKINPSLLNINAIQICKTLNQEGFQAFIVGGCIRDLLLNQTPKDWDIATDALPSQVMTLFKCIPTGLAHGTVTVVMGEGTENHFEVTTFRIDGNYVDGRHPEKVYFVQKIEQDLARRDFTINAIAYDPITGYLADPFNGINDFNIIKAVGDPAARFKEDGLRIMRAARFAARFNYDIHAETYSAMINNIGVLSLISKERLKDELSKTLMTNNPEIGLYLLKDCGALNYICPNLNCDNISKLTKNSELETKLAILYAENTSAKQDLLNLRFSNNQIKKTYFLIALLEKYKEFIAKNTELGYKSFMAVIKNHSIDSWENTLTQFNILIDELGCINLLDSFDAKVWSKSEMNINGDDLISLKIEQGPRIKQILEACYLEILRNPENNNKMFLLEFAVTI